VLADGRRLAQLLPKPAKQAYACSIHVLGS
jgi:hypothetical protein